MDNLNEPKEDNSQALFLFIRRLLANWYWFALSAIVCLIGAFIYLRYSTPVYQVNAEILITDDNKRGNSNAQLTMLNDLMGGKSKVDNEVLVLNTFDLMRSVVLEQKGYIRYYAQGKVKTSELEFSAQPVEVLLLSDVDSIRRNVTFELTREKNNGFTLNSEDTIIKARFNDTFQIKDIGKICIIPTSNFSKPIGGDLLINFNTVNNITASYQNNLSLDIASQKSSVINLSLKYPLPHKGEYILNGLILNYIRQNINDKNEVADSTLAFIADRLAMVTKELAGLEDNISDYKRNNRLIDIPTQAAQLIEGSDEAIKEMASTEVQLQALQQMERYLKNDTTSRVVPALSMLQDPVIGALITQYNQLILDYERLHVSSTRANPALKNVAAQIERLKGDMIANISNNIRQLQLVKQKYTQRNARLGSEINRIPTMERGFTDMSRMQQIKQAQYVFLQQAWEETAIGRTSNVSNIKMIDSPRASNLPVSPKGNIIYLAALLLGFFIPGGVFYLRDLLNTRVRSREDVTSVTSIPIYGEIGSGGKEEVVINRTARTGIAEQFRALRTNLDFVQNTKNAKTIVVTSSIMGEGKSFVALNLAVTIALLGKKVLLLELDLRKPTILKKLGLSAKKGFSTYVSGQGKEELDQIIIPSGIEENLFILPSGIIPPNPAELILSQATEALFESLKQEYDYLVIDSPPVGMVTDAFLFSKYADQALFLVKHNYSYKNQVAAIQHYADEGKFARIGLVLNDIKAKDGYGYGYGFGYGYGVSYGSFSNDEKLNQKPWWKVW
ncbi:MAG: polysaccharide biosynthesis tyrosine autokinase [Saprospiraceae bacterium]|nr:polysaccharide biosynthesis tyrosine autokinase [Saprospiraceae bacterium]